MKKVGNGLVAGVLALSLSLLFAACGPNGSGAGGGNQVTVTLKDPQSQHVATYYRVGSGSWQQLTFQNNQATFPAQGAVEYEVATRCQGGGNIADLQFFKASTSQTRQVNVTCSHGQGQGGQRVSVTFNVQLPSQIGG